MPRGCSDAHAAPQCVLANLIYRKYIKARAAPLLPVLWHCADRLAAPLRPVCRAQGYLSHKSRVLVLSKANPFPPLAAAAVNEPL